MPDAETAVPRATRLPVSWSTAWIVIVCPGNTAYPVSDTGSVDTRGGLEGAATHAAALTRRCCQYRIDRVAPPLGAATPFALRPRVLHRFFAGSPKKAALHGEGVV
jgi:hypothetical protein